MEEKAVSFYTHRKNYPCKILTPKTAGVETKEVA